MLVPRLGSASGAAIAVLASVVSFQVALTVQTWLLQRVHPFYSPCRAGAASPVALAAAQTALHRFVPDRAARIALVIAGRRRRRGGVAGFGLGPEERQLLRRLVGRLRRPTSLRTPTFLTP